MYSISAGIMAYNEEGNIGRLLDAVLSQELINGELKEIIVVASGCTDSTEDIVRKYTQIDSRVRLLTQAKREGKASAINYFLSRATGDIYILESGDTIPCEGTYERLVKPFEDPRVGMTGAHPVPVNSKDNFIGFVVHMMWSLHHRIALQSPKLGELVAFRSIVRKIPNDSAVDEASIEAIIRAAGMELQYCSEAYVQNKGPENIKDFLKQRRRIAAGHKHLARDQGYVVSTTDPKRIFRMILDEHNWKPRDTMWTLGGIGLEFIGRMLGYYDYYIKKKNPYIWDIATTTKRWD
jgi:cellulose synthase/poly-beta-1,6-N-acetylglucosamine synthase-like glycosyltransferase